VSGDLLEHLAPTLNWNLTTSN